MHGFRLEVEAHIVFAASAPLQNLTTCLRRLGVQVTDVVLAPLASAEAVLSEEEREMGVVLADIGAGTTDIVIYQDGSVSFCKVLGVGGNHVTNDLALFLHMQFAAAEEVKNRYGHALPSMVAQEDMVWVAGFGSEGERPVLQRRLAEIVHARATEILQLIHKEVERAGFAGRVPAGLVLTGGAANMRGIEALAREHTNGPARVGIPQGAHGLADSLDDPAYATPLGLLLWGLRFGVWDQYQPRASWLVWPRAIQQWLRDLLPGDG
jgi:cell division protein FtsA